MRCARILLTALSAAMLLGAAGCSKASAPPKRAPAKKSIPPAAQTAVADKTSRIGEPGGGFVLGVNYPWNNYGHDFGETPAWSHDGVGNPSMGARIRQDFSWLKSNGIHSVRWFLFADGRASPEFDSDGNVTGLDEHFFQDMDTALAIAEENGISIIFVLFDYLLCQEARIDNGVQLGGHASLITQPSMRQSMIVHALKPMLERYGQHPAIAGWDVMNEPEGAMTIVGGNWIDGAVAAEDMQAFVREVVTAIHRDARQPVTLGSSSRGMLSNWTEAGLDFYQFHYYDPMETEYPLETTCASLDLDKPCIVGEIPTKNTKQPVRKYLDIVIENGYAGAFLWSLKGVDESSGLEEALPEISAWANDNALRLAKTAPPTTPK
jgi:cellulase (glycosyl hydrolase family 5)